LLASMGIHSTVRASFTIYNTEEDVDKTIRALVELKKFWS
jgi:selenocysteine lyase/cysteine desulfurase